MTAFRTVIGKAADLRVELGWRKLTDKKYVGSRGDYINVELFQMPAGHWITQVFGEWVDPVAIGGTGVTDLKEAKELAERMVARRFLWMMAEVGRCATRGELAGIRASLDAWKDNPPLPASEVPSAPVVAPDPTPMTVDEVVEEERSDMNALFSDLKQAERYLGEAFNRVSDSTMPMMCVVEGRILSAMETVEAAINLVESESPE